MISKIKAWLDERKKLREARAHAEWVSHFDEEMKDPHSRAYLHVLKQGEAMARGMVMRHYDDHGIRRCLFCMSTDQLHKRQSGKRIWFACKEHAGIALPEPKAPVGSQRKATDGR